MYEALLVPNLQGILDGLTFRSPQGVALRRGSFGLGLYATRAFASDEVIYSSGWFTVPNEPHSYRVLAEIDDDLEYVDVTSMHSVKYGDSRTFDIPGCFMNHSCQPTSISIDRADTGTDVVTSYDQVALRDLNPGDPITCDYTLFDWDCDGHQFACNCGAEHCYGYIAGFSGLPADIQQRLADRITYESARRFFADSDDRTRR